MVDFTEFFASIASPASSNPSSRLGGPLGAFISSLTGGGRRLGGFGRVTPEFVIDGLTKRGLPSHVAEAFALNFGDESGFDPGINEISPLVKGSRGGFGLPQFTGPRRRAFEAFAAERGVAPDDPDAQLDFVVQELQTTEKRAASRILATNTVGEAAAAVVTDFLRPAPENRDRRVERFRKLDGGDRPGPPQPNPLRLWLDLDKTRTGVPNG